MQKFSNLQILGPFICYLSLISCGTDTRPEEFSEIKGSCLGHQVEVSWTTTRTGIVSDNVIINAFYNTGYKNCVRSCPASLAVNSNAPTSSSGSTRVGGSASGTTHGVGVSAEAGADHSVSRDGSSAAATTSNTYVVTGSCTPYSSNGGATTTMRAMTPEEQDIYQWQRANCVLNKEVARYSSRLGKYICVNINSLPQGGGYAPRDTVANCPASGGCPSGQFRNANGYCATFASYPAYTHCG